SIVVLASERYGVQERPVPDATFVPFTAQTRMSGVDLEGSEIRKGATDAIRRYVEAKGGSSPPTTLSQVEKISREGGTPLVV
ncbi:potassium-transporting ATPase subunit B, partial [Acinetobacter baumannii]